MGTRHDTTITTYQEKVLFHCVSACKGEQKNVKGDLPGCFKSAPWLHFWLSLC